MKANLHPEFKEVTVRCACGNTFKTYSTKGDISVEVCSKCHPFYTGQNKNVEKGGMVEKFNKKFRRNK